jgi:hypothetical protein
MQFSTVTRSLPYPVRVAIVAALAFAAMLAIASPAAAQTVPISCTGTQTTNFGPPLGPIPQDTSVTVRERLGTFANNGGQCVGPVTGGHSEVEIQQQASCLVPSPGGAVVIDPPNVFVYHWDNGEQSTIVFTVTTVVRVGGQSIITSVGTVTEGFNQGAPAVRHVTLLDLNLQDCLTSSVEQLSGPVVLTIG